jgi:hypothetical protein
LLATVRGREEELTVFVPYTAADTLSLIYAGCRVVGSEAGDAGLTLQLAGASAVMSRVKRSLRKEA